MHRSTAVTSNTVLMALLMIGIGVGLCTPVEAAQSGNLANLIAAPVQYPPETIKFKGKPAVVATISAFGAGGFSITVEPLPGLSPKVTRGEITCNRGVLVLHFDPRETYTGVLQSCPPSSKIAITLQ